MARQRVQHLTIFLLKENVETQEAAIKNPERLRILPIPNPVGFEGTLFVQAPRPKPPRWLTFLHEGFGDELGPLSNASSAAVLLLTTSGRRFAVTFGYGRNLLKPEAFERDFGLKVVLNTVDPDQLRSLDARTFEELTLVTKRQTSRGSGLSAFGLDVSHDLLSSLTGKPRDETFARRVTGADGLVISAPLPFVALAAKCDDALQAYRSDAYKEQFEFIDHMRRVRDPLAVTGLNTLLVERLKAPDLNGLHMAPPEAIAWDEVEGFTFSTDNGGSTFADLEVDDFLRTLAADDVSLDVLKGARIGVKYFGSDQSIEKWSVYQSIVFEARQNGVLYVLSGGDWFKISETFTSRVDARVQSVAATLFELPPTLASDSTEATYNERVASDRGYVLMDRKLETLGGTAIEVCDLLTQAKQFIHVKRKTRSSSLSHLFNQGVNSAEAFFSESQFRGAVRAAAVNAVPQMAQIISDNPPAFHEYEVVFAVIARRRGDWPLSIPFFSRLSLKNAADRLERLGYRVSLVLVEQAV